MMDVRGLGGRAVATKAGSLREIVRLGTVGRNVEVLCDHDALIHHDALIPEGQKDI